MYLYICVIINPISMFISKFKRDLNNMFTRKQIDLQAFFRDFSTNYCELFLNTQIWKVNKIYFY